MKLKQCYLPFVDAGQIIRVKRYQDAEGGIILKKLRLVAGFYGRVGLKRFFTRYNLFIPEPAEKAEKLLRPYTVTPVFGQKIEISGSELFIREVGSLTHLYQQVKVLQREITALKMQAIQDKQTASFLQQPNFKQMMTIFDMINEGVEIFGSKFKSFGAGYTYQQPGQTEGSE